MTSLALTHATLHTMRGTEVLRDHTLVVRGERIEAIAPSALMPPPADAT
jgi:cytosine/adenosine deaminase-related metal-dependent hydrolase